MPRATRTFPPFDPIAHALSDLPNSRRGLTCCNGQCRDLSTDTAHGGVCDNGSCGNLAVCRVGACVCPSGATCPTGGLSGCCPAGSGPPSGCCEFPNSECCPPEDGRDGNCCYVGFSCCHGDCCTGNSICCTQGCCHFTFTCCPAGSGPNCCPPDTPVGCPANAQNPDGYCCPAQTTCCAAGCCPTGAADASVVRGIAERQATSAVTRADPGHAASA